jgi:uncharacterized protein
VDHALNSTELRVLGALIEKETTTPEYYPLTLNSLLSACNQKTNRWPVTSYNENDVMQAIEALRARRFAAEIIGNGRVPKYAQRFTEALNLGRREAALLCVLMLRGPQTIGELKDRTERLHAFADTQEIENVLEKLMERTEGPLATKFSRLPGQKEPRYMHLLGGPVEQENSMPSESALSASYPERLAILEAEMMRLRQDVDALRRRLDEVL